MKALFHCKKCSYKSPYKSQYDRHLETTLHKTGKRKTRRDKIADIHKCKDCSFETPNIGNFKIHILNNHATEETRKAEFKYYCVCCRFGTNVKILYERHNSTSKHKKMSA